MFVSHLSIFMDELRIRLQNTITLESTAWVFLHKHSWLAIFSGTDGEWYVYQWNLKTWIELNISHWKQNDKTRKTRQQGNIKTEILTWIEIYRFWVCSKCGFSTSLPVYERFHKSDCDCGCDWMLEVSLKMGSSKMWFG